MLRCIAALVSPLCMAATAAPTARIELMTEAKVSRATVNLGDLAVLRSSDLGLMRRLVNLPVGVAPQGGQSAVVQRDALAVWVRRQVGVADGQLEWGGADEGRVVRVQARLRGEDVGQAAVAALRSSLSAAGVAGDVKLVAVPRDLDVPEGELRLQPRPTEQAPLRSRMLVWVDVRAGGTFVRTVPVRVALDTEPRVAAWLPNAASAARPDREAIGERMVRGPEEPVVVSRGDWAALRWVAGAVALESRVEVLQDGRPGQRIRVRQQGATGVVFARVIGRGQLELAP